MGIERTIERTRKRNTTLPEYIGGLISPSGEQTEITERWILPYQELILQDVRELRKKVDRAMQQDAIVRKRMRIWDKEYPEGLCQEIRDGVLDLMKRGMLNSDRPGLSALKNFVRAGGIVQPFWGIDKEMYFQNVIQLGDSILDVANDTVDRSKEPVVLYPQLHNAPIKRIETMEQFADIAEKYWDLDVYPNIYLPWFAPVFPIIAIEPASRDLNHRERLVLQTAASNIVYANMYALRDEHLFGLSSDFISKSAYSDKRLPHDMLENLLSHQGTLARPGRKRPDIFRIATDPEEALAEIRYFHFGKNDFEQHNIALLRKYLRDAKEILAHGNDFYNVSLANRQR